MTDFRNFFGGDGGGRSGCKPEEGGLNTCKIVYGEKGWGARGRPCPESGGVDCACRSTSRVLAQDCSWRLGKNPSTGNNLVIAEIFGFSPDK